MLLYFIWIIFLISSLKWYVLLEFFQVIKPGIKDIKAKQGDTVKMNLCGRLEDGTVVDQQDEFVFTINDGEVRTKDIST